MDGGRARVRCVLVADEHPGAFLEDELEDQLPFAPRPAEPDPAARPPGEEPWAWFQRWRVPITALFVVLIALAVALAFGAKPDEAPAPREGLRGSTPPADAAEVYRDVVGPDGVKRRVRVVAPTL